MVMIPYYNDLIASANVRMGNRKAYLESILTPFEVDVHFTWIVTPEILAYIGNEFRNNVAVSYESDWFASPSVGQIRYRGDQVKLRGPDLSGDPWDEIFPAVTVPEYHQGLIDRLPIGARVLIGNSVLEVIPGPNNSHSVTVFCTILSTAQEGDVLTGRFRYGNETYISYDSSRGRYSDSSMFSGRNWEMDDIVGRTRRDPKRDLCDNFESADLSILFG